MKALLLLLLLPLLAACASPSHDYFGVPSQSVTRDGREFRVFLRRDGAFAQVQVIRMGWAGMRDHQPVIEAMIAAAEEVSGCAHGTQVIGGDSGVLNLRLRCDGAGG